MRDREGEQEKGTKALFLWNSDSFRFFPYRLKKFFFVIKTFKMYKTCRKISFTYPLIMWDTHYRHPMAGGSPREALMDGMVNEALLTISLAKSM